LRDRLQLRSLLLGQRKLLGNVVSQQEPGSGEHSRAAHAALHLAEAWAASTGAETLASAGAEASSAPRSALGARKGGEAEDGYGRSDAEDVSERVSFHLFLQSRGFPT
jgi:hypothetical protein